MALHWSMKKSEAGGLPYNSSSIWEIKRKMEAPWIRSVLGACRAGACPAMGVLEAHHHTASLSLSCMPRLSPSEVPKGSFYSLLSDSTGNSRLG